MSSQHFNDFLFSFFFLQSYMFYRHVIFGLRSENWEVWTPCFLFYFFYFQRITSLRTKGFSRGTQFGITSHILSCHNTHTTRPLSKDFIVRASVPHRPWPLLGPLPSLFLFPCISSIFVSESVRTPLLHPLYSLNQRIDEWPARLL